MNEPVNFIAGSIDGCTTSHLDNPPFTPRTWINAIIQLYNYKENISDVDGKSLLYRALCPSSQQYLSEHYNLHSMYGYFESQVSNMYDTFRKMKRRIPIYSF